MQVRRTTSGLRALGLAVVLGAGLAGCTLPDVSMSPDVSTGSAARSTAAPATTSATTPPAATTAPASPEPASLVAAIRPAGDLDTGSLTHALAAGNRTVVIDYWTDEDALSWTAADTRTVELAAHIEGGGTRQDIKVTRFLATTDDGTVRTTVAEDRGEFALTPPYSYSTALSLLPSPAEATTVTLYVQFELLVETQSGSGEFFRQTVLDSIELPLIQEDSP